MSAEGGVLILAASAGAGHLVAARALAEELAMQAPSLPVEVHDVLQSSTGLFRRLYAGGYDALVRHLPSGMNWLYELTDRPSRFGFDRLRVTFQHVNTCGTRRWLLSRRPRLIINTHFLPAEIVAHLRRRQRLRCPQVTVVTDFEPHRLWAQHPTERYYTAFEEGRAHLATWGVDPQRVRVTGIPVRATFRQRQQPGRLRRRLGLDPGQPVVLVLCGGCGAGATLRWLEALLRLRRPVQLVVVTGRNTHLHQSVAAFLRRVPRPVRLLAYTDQMPAWMQAADLLISKPGGLTASEALVCGLPLVIVSPIPGQEARNSDYLLEYGAAIKASGPRALAYRVEALLADETRRRSLRERALALARPAAAERIIADALSLLLPSVEQV